MKSKIQIALMLASCFESSEEDVKPEQEEDKESVLDDIPGRFIEMDQPGMTAELEDLFKGMNFSNYQNRAQRRAAKRNGLWRKSSLFGKM